jgi:cytochrome P450 family 142 subfamily A polypeptide 1
VTITDPATFAQGGVDLLDGEMYKAGAWPVYEWLRAHDPVHWDPVNELWGITKYDDIVAIEKAKDVFISSDTKKGGYRPNLPADPSIIGLDDPLHTRRRMLVNRGFTPRTVLQWEDHINQTITGLLDAAQAKGPQGRVEVITELAAPLPAQMIGLLLGYPHEMWPKLKEWSERTIVGGGGPRYATDDVIFAAFEFAGACAELYEEKQRCPADDIMTVWTTAEIAGEPIGLDPVISDCLLLLDGGAETTRTVIGRTILELAQRPDQWQLLKDGADMEVATEEFIRWVTPVLNMCRVATRDYELRGKTIKAGDQVVLMYPSANRDEEHFTDPERYDVTRDPNHHIAFGFGTHFCLGAALARLEIKTFFEHFVRRVERVHVVDGSVDFLANAFVAGLNRAEIELEFVE